jgi:hypothetical protein
MIYSTILIIESKRDYDADMPMEMKILAWDRNNDYGGVEPNDSNHPFFLLNGSPTALRINKQ